MIGKGADIPNQGQEKQELGKCFCEMCFKSVVCSTILYHTGWLIITIHNINEIRPGVNSGKYWNEKWWSLCITATRLKSRKLDCLFNSLLMLTGGFPPQRISKVESVAVPWCQYGSWILYSTPSIKATAKYDIVYNDYYQDALLLTWVSYEPSMGR